jgi:predicted DsbA family dithiol-disulfide isomerase
MTDADIRFYFDPVCPFAWITSRWVRMVAAQRDYAVDWRFISVRMINSPGAAELKRSLRERPRQRSFGADPDAAGAEEEGK